jgi:hypothetical protein
MEINKENFIKEILEFTSDRTSYVLISECHPEDEYNEYMSSQNSRLHFIECCIDFLYLNCDFELLKNTYKRICFLILELDRAKMETDFDIEIHTEVENSDIKMKPINVLNGMNEKISILSRFKKYLEQYIDIIEPIKIELSSDKMPDIQKAYFFYFLFNEISKGTDRTQQAKIVSSLLEKTINAKGYNENIYTFLRVPFDTEKPKLEIRIEHLMEVKKIFENLKAERIVSNISKEIEKLKKKIEK